MSASASSPRSTPPPLELTSGSWRRRAACLEHPTLPAHTWDDALGPGHRETEEMRAARVERAKAVCRTCPVIDHCWSDVDLHYDEGVRGGNDLREVKARIRQAKWDVA